MPERFSAGDRVLVAQPDVAVHTRAPRYVRGRIGVLWEPHGEHLLPDSVVAGEHPPGRGTVWAVEFTAEELFGHTDHAGHRVIVNLWEHYLKHAQETAW